VFQRALLRDSDIEPLAAGVARVLNEVGILCQNNELLRALAAAGARVDLAAERAWFPRRLVAEFVEQLQRERAGRIRQDAARPWKEDSSSPLRSRVGAESRTLRRPPTCPSAEAGPGAKGKKGGRRSVRHIVPTPERRDEREEQERRDEQDSGCRPFPSLGLPDLETQVAQFVIDHATDERRSGNKADFVRLVQFGDALHGDQGVGHCLLLTDVPPLVEPLEAGLLLAEHVRKPHAALRLERPPNPLSR